MKDYKKIILERKIMQSQTLQLFQTIHVETNTWLLHQGDRLHNLYILVKGRIKVCSTTANGITHLSAISYPITVLGEVEFLSGLAINNDIYTLNQCTFLVASVDCYSQILSNDLLFVQFLAKQVANKLYNMNHNTSISINYPVENRLAAYFVSCHMDGIVKDNFMNVATLLGCSYRQLQRVIKHFCQQMYIKKCGRSMYEILDWEHLKQLGQELYRLQ